MVPAGSHHSRTAAEPAPTEATANAVIADGADALDPAGAAAEPKARQLRGDLEFERDLQLAMMQSETTEKLRKSTKLKK